MLALPSEQLANISPDCRAQVKLASEWKVSELEHINDLNDMLAIWTAWFARDYRRIVKLGVSIQEVETVLGRFQNEIAQDVRDLKWFLNVHQPKGKPVSLEDAREWVNSRIIKIAQGESGKVEYELNFADVENPGILHAKSIQFAAQPEAIAA